MTVSLQNKTVIRCTVEAHKYYNTLCKGRPGLTGEEDEGEESAEAKPLDEDIEAEVGSEQFADGPQAFYCAAVIGHLVQMGKRYEVKGEVKDLLRRADQWDRPDKQDIREPLSVLAKLHYGVTDPDEILQVVAELAEVGIRRIYEEVRETGQFDFQARIADLRELGKKSTGG
jgi:hypothetical protein